MASIFDPMQNQSERTVNPNVTVMADKSGIGRNTVQADPVREAEKYIITSGTTPEDAKRNAVNNPGIFDNLIDTVAKGFGDAFGTIGQGIGAGVNTLGQGLGAVGGYLKDRPELLGLLGSYAVGRTIGAQGPLGADAGGAFAGGQTAEDYMKIASENKKIQAEKDIANANNINKNNPIKPADITGFKNAVVASKDIQGKISQVEKTLEKLKAGKIGGGGEILTKIGLKGNVNVKEYDTIKGLTLSNMARSLGGERGVLTDKDLERIEAAWPKITDTKEERSASIEMVRQIIDEGVKNKAQALGLTPESIGYKFASNAYSNNTVNADTGKKESSSTSSTQRTISPQDIQTIQEGTSYFNDPANKNKPNFEVQKQNFIKRWNLSGL